jgi:hypothetical protein
MDEANELERLKARGPVVSHLREMALIFLRASEQPDRHQEAFGVAAVLLRDAAEALAPWAEEGER